MKLREFIAMQIDYFVFNLYKRRVEKSDERIKRLREELEVEEAYNTIVSKKTLKICKEYKRKYGIINEGRN